MMDIELAILNAIQTIHSPFLDVVVRLITYLGNANIIWILFTLLLLWKKKDRKEGINQVIAMILLGLIVNLTIKPLVHRTRPCDVNTAVLLLINHPSDYSFPSGHTAASIAFASVLLMMGDKKKGIPSLILGCLIAFSRMYLYVHWPTDILGGAVFGILCAGIAVKWIGPWVTKKYLAKFVEEEA